MSSIAGVNLGLMLTMTQLPLCTHFRVVWVSLCMQLQFLNGYLQQATYLIIVEAMYVLLKNRCTRSVFVAFTSMHKRHGREAEGDNFINEPDASG